MKHSLVRSLSRGFSLVEVMVILGGIALIVAIGAVSLTGVKEKAMTQKLSQDLVAINKAVRLYQVNGGDWDAFLTAAASSPADAITILKRKATALSGEQLAGFTGQFMDQRMKPVMQTAPEAATNQPRLLWDATKKRFVVATSGPRGIKKFEMMTDAGEIIAAGGTEVRTGTMKLAVTDEWVWDYDDRALVDGAGPTEIGLTPGMSPGDPTVPPAKLIPPYLIPTGGYYYLMTYPKPVSFVDPNYGGVSEVVYSILPGIWVVWDGNPIVVSPGMKVTAYARSLDTANYEDSDYHSDDYLTTPEQLMVAYSGPTAVTYAEVGGAMEPGGPPVTLNDTGTITLTNGGSIPTSYQNSGTFNVYWTLDGVTDPLDPGTPPGLYAGDAFTGGFPGQSVDLSLSKWGTETTLPLQIAAKSYNTDIVINSTVETPTIAVATTDLRPPTVSENSGTVTIGKVTAFGDMPVGARIYYTTDGTFPEDVGGEPGGATEYTGPFSLDGVDGNDCGHYVIVARVYGPTGYTQWFKVSASASLSVEIPPDPGTAQKFSYDYAKSSFSGYSLVAVAGEGQLEFKDDAQIFGDIAVGPGVKRKFSALQLNGSYDVDAASTVDVENVTDSGGNPVTPNTVDLSSVITEATTLSAQAAALTPTQVFGKIEEPTTIYGTAPDGMNIIQVEEIKLDKENLTLAGGPDSWFIFNVEKTIEFKDSGVTAPGGTPSSQILFNSWDGSDVKVEGDRNILGTILAPGSKVQIKDDANIDGTLVVGKDSKIEKTGNVTGVGNSFAFECSGSGVPEPPEVLEGPVFSMLGGVYPANQFDLSVTLSNPNAAGSSTIEFSWDGSTWMTYNGAPLTVAPGAVIYAYADSLDDGEWTDSATVDHTYTAGTSQLLEPEITSTANKFDNGANTVITVTITNPNPPALGNLMYKLDGSPTWLPYGGPFDLSVVDYATTTAFIEAQVQSVDPGWEDSDLATKYIESAEPVPLGKPLIDLQPGPTGTTVDLTNTNPPGSSEMVLVLVPVPSQLGCDLIHGNAGFTPPEAVTYTGPIFVDDVSYPDGFAVISYSKALAPGYLDSPPVIAYDESDVIGLSGGHFDVDSTGRSTYDEVWASWPGGGSTDKHSHEYDNKNDTAIVDMYVMDGAHATVPDNVSLGERFKIIVLNANLSPYAHIAINEEPTYSAPYVTTYDDIPFASLPIYSVDGIAGTTQLTSLAIVFDDDAIMNAGLLPSNTGDVKGNTPGKANEWRNGALTVQIVGVDAAGNIIGAPLDGTISNGDHGVASDTSMLHEVTIFWHWPGKSYHEAENMYVPGDQTTVVDGLDESEEPVCSGL